MTTALSKADRRTAVQMRDKKYDGVFYFVVKTSGKYCRPSCSALRSLQDGCYFFDSVDKARQRGYVACKHCHPERIRYKLAHDIVDSIEAGAVNDKGVRGLAESFHISERQLRRIVYTQTGTSPLRYSKIRCLYAAKRLIVETTLPIIDVAFTTEFSSLRQFNDDFKGAFKTSPREMRKSVLVQSL